MGAMIDRAHKELTEEDVLKIVCTFHNWRGEKLPEEKLEEYVDVPGFCMSTAKEQIAEHGYVLTPGRYVGAEEIEDDGEPFEEKIERLVELLYGQFKESKQLQAEIIRNMDKLGFEG